MESYNYLASLLEDPLNGDPQDWEALYEHETGDKSLNNLNTEELQALLLWQVAALRRQKLDGSVSVVFIVGTDGRVVNPVVQSSTNPAFEQPALQAVRRWRFEPGQRNGKAVTFKMRVPIAFRSR